MRSGNMFLLIAGVVVVLLIAGILIRTHVVRASMYTLYASSCLGGWQDTGHATGAPDASAFEEEVFTRENSATLRDDVSAQIFCGDFQGNVDQETVPTKITVKFSWGATYPIQPVDTPRDSSAEKGGSSTSAHDGVEGVVGPLNGEDTDTASSTAALDVTATSSDSDTEHTTERVEGAVDAVLPVELVPPQPDEVESRVHEEQAGSEGGVPEAPQEVPAPHAPMSFLRLLGQVAFAQEEVHIPASTTDMATTTLDDEASEPASTTTGVDHGEEKAAQLVDATEALQGVVEVRYTLDGVFWKSLGYVEYGEFWSKTFEIPIAEASQWEDIANIQISIQRALRIDQVTPTIFLDAVWLEVGYTHGAEEVLGVPDTLRGDIFVHEVREENQTLVLVERPNVGGTTTELWLHDSRLVEPTSIETTGETKRETVPAEPTARVADDASLLATSSVEQATTSESVSSTNATSVPTKKSPIPTYAPSGWMLVAGADMVAHHSPVGFVGGTALWLSPDRQALVGIDGVSKGQFSQTIEPFDSTILYYNSIPFEVIITEREIRLVPLEHGVE